MIDFRTTYYLTPTISSIPIDVETFIGKNNKIKNVSLFPRDIVVVQVEDLYFRIEPGDINFYKYLWDISDDRDRKLIKKNLERARFPRRQFIGYQKNKKQEKYKISEVAVLWYMSLILGASNEI